MTGIQLLIMMYCIIGFILAGLSHAALYEYDVKFKSVWEYILKVWIAIGLFWPLTGLVLWLITIISITKKLIKK